MQIQFLCHIMALLSSLSKGKSMGKPHALQPYLLYGKCWNGVLLKFNLHFLNIALEAKTHTISLSD